MTRPSVCIKRLLRFQDVSQAAGSPSITCPGIYPACITGMTCNWQNPWTSPQTLIVLTTLLTSGRKTMTNHQSLSEHFGWKFHPFSDAWSMEKPFYSRRDLRIADQSMQLLHHGKSFAITGPFRCRKIHPGSAPYRGPRC